MVFRKQKSTNHYQELFEAPNYEENRRNASKAFLKYSKQSGPI